GEALGDEHHVPTRRVDELGEPERLGPVPRRIAVPSVLQETLLRRERRAIGEQQIVVELVLNAGSVVENPIEGGAGRAAVAVADLGRPQAAEEQIGPERSGTEGA